MGENGCGKKTLIIKLNQIINNGETLVYIINMNPETTDNYIYQKLEEINELAKNRKQNEIWVYFDQMNICLSLILLTEIFVNRSYYGNKLSENIRLIGGCNPYRKRKLTNEKCGLIKDDDKVNELIYLVQPLPQTLLYYVFNFGSINESDEKKYIHSLIEKIFLDDEKSLHKITTEAIFQCHRYLRRIFDPSIVSLKEIPKFLKCVYFFLKYYSVKNNYEIEIKKIKEN